MPDDGSPPAPTSARPDSDAPDASDASDGARTPTAPPRSTRLRRPDDPSLQNAHLDAYLARTQTPLDLLALLTMWFTLVPLGDLAGREVPVWPLLVGRLALSAVYLTDFVIRARLSTRPWRYTRSHPLGLLASVFPPARVLFSVRLIGTLFRSGALERFIVAALILVMNISLMVYFYERDAAGANITTVGGALWWAVVTVTTVGYGDEYPITTRGQLSASFLMGVGVVVLAVVTAHVSSAFVEQRRRALQQASEAGVGESSLDANATEATAATPATDDAALLAELSARIDNLEAALHARLDAGDAGLRARLDQLEGLLRASGAADDPGP